MTERDSFDAEFANIVGDYEDKLRDPAVTGLLENVAQAEEELAEAGEMAVYMQEETLVALNMESDDVGMLNSHVLVSGKVRLRPELVGLAENEVALSSTLAGFGVLGSIRQDAKGPYFEVIRHVFAFGEFAISDDVPEDASDPDVTEKKIIAFLNAVDDEDTPLDMLFAYPEELGELLPEEPSDLMVDQEILENYPDIARQLEALPIDCEDDERIIASLQSVRIEINWRNYPRHLEDERAALIERIERYITNRVQFDTDTYLLSLRDHIDVVGIGGEHFPKSVVEGLILSGRIGHVRLLPEHDNTGDDIMHYRLKLEFLAPSGTRGAGNNLMYIPLSSITSVGNMRNPDIFGISAAEFPDENEDEIIPANNSHSQRARDIADEDAHEIVGDKLTVNNREMELRDINNLIGTLFDNVSEITDKKYDSKDEMFLARTELGELIAAFNRHYPHDQTILIEAEGPGVRGLNSKFSQGESELVPDKNGSVTLRFNGVELSEADIFTTRRGYYDLHASIQSGVIKNDEADHERYDLVANLYLIEAGTAESIDIADRDDTQQLLHLRTEREFVACINNDMTKLSIPEFERYRKCRVAINRIGEHFPDLTELPSQLIEFQKRVDEATGTDEFVDFGDVSVVHAIGESVAGDEDAAQYTVDAVMEILGDHPVRIVGEMYSEDGLHAISQSMEGRVSNVISTHPQVPSDEPMIVMQTLEDGDWYVPLATIKRFGL